MALSTESLVQVRHDVPDDVDSVLNVEYSFGHDGLMHG
jgi:hypothetical protein